MKAKKNNIMIRSNIDAIKLADEIKGDLTTEWLKRYNNYFKPKSRLVKQS